MENAISSFIDKFPSFEKFLTKNCPKNMDFQCYRNILYMFLLRELRNISRYFCYHKLTWKCFVC